MCASEDTQIAVRRPISFAAIADEMAVLRTLFGFHDEADEPLDHASGFLSDRPDPLGGQREAVLRSTLSHSETSTGWGALTVPVSRRWTA